MKVYVSNYLSKSISIIDYDTLTLEKEIKLDENIYPHHFCIDKEKGKMYLPSSSNGILYVLDMKAWHVQLDKYKSEIYVSTLDGKVVIIDEESLGTKKVFDEFLLPVQISFNYKDKKVYIADLGYKNIKILDYNQGKYIGHIDIDGIPQGLEISQDEEKLFISDTQKNSVKVYDTSTNQLIKEIKVGKEPTTIICM